MVEVRPIEEFQQDAFASIRKQDFNTALVHADACRVHHPQAPECHLLLGVLQGRAGQRKASRHHYRMFLKYAPEDAPYRERISAILEKDGDIQGDSPPPTWLLDALPLVKGASPTRPAPRAATAPQEAPAVPSEALELHALADKLISQNRFTEALEKAASCADRYPQLADCQLSLGQLHGKLDNLALSQRHYARFLTLAPQNHPLRSRVTAILRKQQ
ncbi:hypothetical protein D7V88_16485 [Corallococcus terminator]|uniref:Uncharacterized protein n=1 Tax=Corallococcus terminator TaxID=2316733 RepID=A0A3A8JCP8_9BACT|nr:hypothetical protein D7V88_16485 [Corallococcus terminator]